MSITESYITILNSSLDKKLDILDQVIELNARQTELVLAESFDENIFQELMEKKGSLIDRLNELDNGFQLVYDNVKTELNQNKDRYTEEIKELQKKISLIMEKSNHIQAEETRNKTAVEKKFASLRKEVITVKKNQKMAANYYNTMNKITSEPVFMDKKK